MRKRHSMLRTNSRKNITRARAKGKKARGKLQSMRDKGCGDKCVCHYHM